MPRTLLDEAAGVVAVGDGLAGRLIRIDHLRDAVPGVVRVVGHIGVDLAALGRDRAGLLDDLAQRAIETVLGTSIIQ